MKKITCFGNGRFCSEDDGRYCCNFKLCYFGKIMIDEFYILNDNYFMTKDEGN